MASSMSNTAEGRNVVLVVRRYTSTAQTLHWVVAALMFIAIALAWVMVNMPTTAPSREWIYTLHKSFGLTILALVAVRLAWRASHPAPPLPGKMAKWEQAMAFASHWLLYLILVGMPVSGYVLSAAASGKAVPYFDLFTLPELPKNQAVSEGGALGARGGRAVARVWADRVPSRCDCMARGDPPGRSS